MFQWIEWLILSGHQNEQVISLNYYGIFPRTELCKWDYVFSLVESSLALLFFNQFRRQTFENNFLMWHIKHMAANKSIHRFCFEAASAVNRNVICQSLSNFGCRFKSSILILLSKIVSLNIPLVTTLHVVTLPFQ